MYKILKNYKDLENREIFGKICATERLETRSLLIKFYADSNNYYPFPQEHIDFKSFLKEELIEEEPEEGFVGSYFLEKGLCLTFKNFKMNFREDLWKLYVKKNFGIRSFKIYKKYFSKIEKKYYLNYLKRARKFFFNRNVRKKLYDFNFYQIASTSKFIKFFEFYLKKLIFYKFKNNVKNFTIPGIICGANFGGILYFIPGLKIQMFTPYGFLKINKQKLTLNILQKEFLKKFGTILPLNIHSVKEKDSNIYSMIARFKSIVDFKKHLKKKILKKKIYKK